MPGVYETTLAVRGYELDSFGHVNHAMYISYLEHARWELLAQEGVTLADFDAWKRWPVIASLQANYLRPAFMSDRLVVRSRIAEVRRTWFRVEQEILRGSDTIFRGVVQVVTVNEAGRPAAMPEELLARWR